MATASEVRLSCGCADERHLGTPCSCDTCAEGLTPEHNPTLCPLTPEERPEAIRKQTYEARKQAVEERMRTAIKMAYNLLYTELGHEATVAGVGVLAVKFYDELRAAEVEADLAAKAEADALQIPSQTQSVKPALVAKQAVGSIFKATVDYSRSLKEMIAAGKYDRVHSDITEEHFPSPAIPVGLPAKQELNLELAHFDRSISSGNAIAELKKMGFRPATLLELLAFGEKYPDEQRKYPIVALGSFWRDWGDGYVPYLWGHADERDLGLSWFERGWGGRCRFLAVRESR